MNKKSQFLFSLLAFCILCGAILLAIALISPPEPLSADGGAGTVERNR